MTRVALALLLCVVAGGVATRAAEAAPKRTNDTARAEARAHHARAEKLYALGRFDEALVAYQAAYEAEALPGFLLNIAQCYRNLDRLDEAIFTFRKYLQLRPSARDREDVEGLIATLENEKAKRAEAAAAEEARREAEVKARADRALQPPPTTTRATPVYKRWWFITSGVVLTGAAVGFAIAASSDGLPDSDLGPIDFTK
jgi:tetratricopeptide (TPR) repeat protein